MSNTTLPKQHHQGMASVGTRELHSSGRLLRRSRYGCRNCKLRKLKCDEGKPECKKCSSFGVKCNFVSNVLDLQPVAANASRLLLVPRKAQLQRPLTNAVWIADASTYYKLNAKCQDFITRYLRQSLITPDDPNMAQVNRQLLKLAFVHPFLMHASLAVAFAYDRQLNGPVGGHRTLEECHHWSQGTVFLSRRLKDPIEAEDRDAIWGAAAALAMLTFSSPDAYTPEKAWPLKSSGSSDLYWLRMIKAKMSLWHIVNPLRPDSIFSVMAATYADMYSPLPERGVDGIPTALASVCNLTDLSTAENNPYFYAAHAVSYVLGLRDIELTTGQTQAFTQSIHEPFESLLQEKDPVALLLLYLWYRKTSCSIWWIEPRARLECPSICMYLRRYHGDNDAVHAFLPGGSFADSWK